jgi:hypothetical protein
MHAVYDRLQGGLEPARAKSCPTDSILFGELEELRAPPQQRVEALHAKGAESAYLCGSPGVPGAGEGLHELNAFFLLTASPEVYNLPQPPTRPAPRVGPGLTRRSRNRCRSCPGELRVGRNAWRRRAMNDIAYVPETTYYSQPAIKPSP